MPLSAKSITQNSMGGTPVLGALATASAARQQEAAALEAEAAAAAAADAADRKKRRFMAAGGADSSDEVLSLITATDTRAQPCRQWGTSYVLACQLAPSTPPIYAGLSMPDIAMNHWHVPKVKGYVTD